MRHIVIRVHPSRWYLTPASEPNCHGGTSYAWLCFTLLTGYSLGIL